MRMPTCSWVEFMSNREIRPKPRRSTSKVCAVEGVPETHKFRMKARLDAWSPAIKARERTEMARWTSGSGSFRRMPARF